MNKQPKTRENEDDQDVISFTFGSDWLSEYLDFSEPITEKRKAKPLLSRIAFDIQLPNHF